MTHCIFNSNINHNRKNLAMEDFPHLQSNNNIPQLVTGKSFASANENIISPNKMIKTSTVVKIEPVDLSYHPFESVFIKRENTNLPTHMYKPNNKEVIIKQEREDAQNILKQENYEEFEVTMEQEKEDNYQEKLPFDIKDEIPFDIKNEFPLDIKDKIPFDIKDEFPLDIKEEVFEEIPTTVNQTSKSSIVKSCPKPLSNTTLKAQVGEVKKFDYNKRKNIERGKIIALHAAGTSDSDIAEAVGVKKRTVRRWIHRYKETGRLVDRPRGGGPRKLTPEQSAKISLLATKNPFVTATIIQNELNLNNVTKQTIRNRLNEN